MFMITPNRRERHRLNVRTQILDAARELFAAEGYEAVTMRRIADAVEYSATALYQHFKDKDTLIRELCMIDCATLAESFQAIANNPAPLERLRKIGMAYVGFGIERPNHYRFLFMSGWLIREEDLDVMGHGNPQQDAYAFLLDTVTEAINQGSFQPHLTDPHLLAQAYWGSIHGAVTLHLANYGDPWVEWRTLEDTARLIIDTMLRGWEK